MQREATPTDCALVLLPRDFRALPREAFEAITEHLALAAADIARDAAPDEVLTLRFSVERV